MPLFSFERFTLKKKYLFIENWILKKKIKKQTENTALNEFFNKFNCLFILMKLLSLEGKSKPNRKVDKVK